MFMLNQMSGPYRVFNLCPSFLCAGTHSSQLCHPCPTRRVQWSFQWLVLLLYVKRDVKIVVILCNYPQNLPGTLLCPLLYIIYYGYSHKATMCLPRAKWLQRLGWIEDLAAAPVLTPRWWSRAPWERECYGITKPSSSYISKCRHLSRVPAGCLPASYHSLRTKQHRRSLLPVCSLSSCCDFCLYDWAHLPCLRYSPGTTMSGSVVFCIRRDVCLKLLSHHDLFLLYRCAIFAQQWQSSQGRCSKVSHF